VCLTRATDLNPNPKLLKRGWRESFKTVKFIYQLYLNCLEGLCSLVCSPTIAPNIKISSFIIFGKSLERLDNEDAFHLGLSLPSTNDTKLLPSLVLFGKCSCPCLQSVILSLFLPRVAAVIMQHVAVD
jgi:hypothetical protein